MGNFLQKKEITTENFVHLCNRSALQSVNLFFLSWDLLHQCWYGSSRPQARKASWCQAECPSLWFLWEELKTGKVPPAFSRWYSRLHPSHTPTPASPCRRVPPRHFPRWDSALFREGSGRAWLLRSINGSLYFSVQFLFTCEGKRTFFSSTHILFYIIALEKLVDFYEKEKCAKKLAKSINLW